MRISDGVQTFALPIFGAIGELEREVFGPVLHVVRYRREELDALIADINATGYGLTFGLHTRLDGMVAQVTGRLRSAERREGKSESVRVDLGGGRAIKKQKLSLSER